MGKSAKHPMQPVVMVDGAARFKQNHLVRYLLDAGPFNMDDLALLPNIPREDWEQFAQLIGYSVNGYGDLSYVREKSVRKADRRAEKLLTGRSSDEVPRRKAETCVDTTDVEGIERLTVGQTVTLNRDLVSAEVVKPVLVAIRAVADRDAQFRMKLNDKILIAFFARKNQPIELGAIVIQPGKFSVIVEPDEAEFSVRIKVYEPYRCEDGDGK